MTDTDNLPLAKRLRDEKAAADRAAQSEQQRLGKLAAMKSATMDRWIPVLRALQSSVAINNRFASDKGLMFRFEHHPHEAGLDAYRCSLAVRDLKDTMRAGVLVVVDVDGWVTIGGDPPCKIEAMNEDEWSQVLSDLHKDMAPTPLAELTE